MNKYFKYLLLIIVSIFTINAKALDIVPYPETTTTTTTVSTTTNLFEGSSYRVYIDDQADLLTETEEKELYEKMKPLTEYGHIGFISVDAHSYASTASFASDTYHKLFGKHSGTIFIIDMKLRKVYIFSDGDNYKKITNSKADSITDNVYTYATDKQYFDCAMKAMDQIGIVLSGAKIAEPMRFASNIFVSLALGFIINFLFALSVSKSKRASVSDVVKKANVSFAVSNISGVKTGTRSVYSPQSSSSGGSGGGGGGGSSGGGGGHSF